MRCPRGPDNAREDAAALVVQWLHRSGLAPFAQAFLDNGYDDLTICSAIQDVDLDAIGIGEPHRQTARRAVAALRARAHPVYFELEPEPARTQGAPAAEPEPSRGEEERQQQQQAPSPRAGPARPGQAGDPPLRRAMAQARFPRLHLLALVREMLLRDRVDLAAAPYTHPSGELGEVDFLAEQFSQELRTQKRDVLEALEYFRQRKINFDKCLHHAPDQMANESKERCLRNHDLQQEKPPGFAQAPCVLLRCDGGMSHPKRSPFTKLFRRRFLKKSPDKIPELIAADITMSDEDRVALMRQVRAGLITTEDAWQRVREYERCRRQQQQQAAETQTDEDAAWLHPRFSPQLNLRKLAHLRLNAGPAGDPAAINRLFEEAGSSAPNSPSNCDSRRRRATPRDFESPYQSDVSLSAPSSPTMESYYEIPYHNLPLPPPGHQRHTYSPPRHGYFFGSAPPPLAGVLSESLSPPSTTTGEDTSSHSTRDSAGPGTRRRRPSTLGELLERLGIAHLHQMLCSHGVTSLHDFSKLTCATLSSIGVQDIEQRAKILTAVELMSDEEEEGHIYSAPADEPPPPPSHAPQRDSGCYGSSDTVGHGSAPLDGRREADAVALSRVPLAEENERGEEAAGDEDEEEEEARPGGVAGEAAAPRVKRTRIKLPTSALRMPRSAVHGDIECRLEINPDGYVANVFCSRATPAPRLPSPPGRLVGSPRAAGRQPGPGPGPSPPQGVPGARPGPPPVSSLRNHADQQSAFVPVGGAWAGASFSGASSSSSSSSQHRPVGGGVRASSFRQSSVDGKKGHFGSPKKPAQTAERLVEEKLAKERIRLSDGPYSDEAGRFGIPLRLIQRYAQELERDLRQVALAMEHIREAQLGELKRHVVSHIEEILTDRYLNCDCIKTESVNEFLVTLGLPMYIPAVLARCQRNKVVPSVDYLIRLSDSELVEDVGFSITHSRWLKEAFIPSVHGKSKTIVSYLDKV